MSDQLVRVLSIVLCSLMVADVSAVTFVHISEDGSPSPLAGSPKTIWVDDDYSHDDPPNHRWKTIGDGVRDAEPGDTVFVFNGTYYRSARINKTINLTGEDPSSTIVDHAEWSVEADWVNITGFNISHSAGSSAIEILEHTERCRIFNNVFFFNRQAIVLWESHNNTIINNSFSLNGVGAILLYSSSYNTIANNSFSRNDNHGIKSWFSSYNRIQNNRMTGGTLDGKIYGDGIRLDGNEVQHWNSHTIDASNTVNGKPILYWKNVTVGTVPSGAGQVILANCTGVVVEHYALSYTSVGIQLGFSSGNTVRNNSFYSNVYDVFLQFSDGNNVTSNSFVLGGSSIVAKNSNDNILTHNEFSFARTWGLWIEFSEGNVITNNGISYGRNGIHLLESNKTLMANNSFDSNKGNGISLHSSNNNSVIHNDFSSNERGIVLDHSSDDNVLSNNTIESHKYSGVEIRRQSAGNLIYHNNITDNRYQALDGNPENNIWHHPLLLEGNYWSDYVGVDDGSGTGKHAISGDGIGDTLIPHPKADFDYYPFTKPGGWNPSPNNPPTANANGPYYVDEGSPLTLDGSNSHDLDNDTLQYRWDLDSDGTWDTSWSINPTTTNTWMDDGTYSVALQVKDSYNETDTDQATVYVRDLPPTVEFTWSPEPQDEGSPVQFNDLSASYPDAIASWSWNFGDGGTSTNRNPNHTYGDNGIYAVTLTVADDDGSLDVISHDITVLNVAPTADAGENKEGYEVSTFTFHGNCTDPGIYDTHTYEWDFDYDGTTFDVDATGQSVTHTWIDDFDGFVALRVTDDDGGIGIDTARVLVKNVPPVVELEVLPIEVDISLRIAGEKWHDVSIELYEDGVLVANGSLTRYPGSPNDQMLNLTHLDVNISKNYSAIVRYTPGDDPINGQPNGANPCWIILTFNDGEESILHHTFNVLHPETYVWEASLTTAILLHGLTFQGRAYDPGADDLTFHWDFGDGTSITCFYPNDNGTFPVEITETVTHAFLTGGSYTVTLTVEDDDGGVGVAIVHLVIP